MKKEVELNHLKGREQISKVFGVSKETVTIWVASGAPIFVIGKKLQANYSELWKWLRHIGMGECATDRPASHSQPQTGHMPPED